MRESTRSNNYPRWSCVVCRMDIKCCWLYFRATHILYAGEPWLRRIILRDASFLAASYEFLVGYCKSFSLDYWYIVEIYNEEKASSLLQKNISTSLQNKPKNLVNGGPYMTQTVAQACAIYTYRSGLKSFLLNPEGTTQEWVHVTAVFRPPDWFVILSEVTKAN